MHNRIVDKLLGGGARGERPAAGEAIATREAMRRQLDQSRRAMERIVAEHPAICLAAAAAAGILVGWWIKRR